MVEATRNFAGLTGINNYVPAMHYTAGLIHGSSTAFSLGAPAASAVDALDTDIDGDATAGTVTVQDWTADSPFGRTLIMQASGDPGNAAVYDVYGRDYLGQPMIERFTHVNGSAPIIYGKKAFYTVEKVVVVTASSNDVTIDLGTGLRLGLPYKADVRWVKENDIFAPLFNRPERVWRTLAAADAVAGGSRFVYADFPGYVKTLLGVPHGGGSTNDPAVTVELATNAVTGLTVTIDTSNAAGLTVTDVPTTEGYNYNNRFVAGDKIEIVSAAAASAGAVDIGLELQPTQYVQPTLTDPATVSTGDPRGTYEPIMTMDGSKEVVVGLVGDDSVNSSGNGGLHGIRHYFA